MSEQPKGLLDLSLPLQGSFERFSEEGEFEASALETESDVVGARRLLLQSGYGLDLSGLESDSLLMGQKPIGNQRRKTNAKAQISLVSHLLNAENPEVGRFRTGVNPV